MRRKPPRLMTGQGPAWRGWLVGLILTLGALLPLHGQALVGRDTLRGLPGDTLSLRHGLVVPFSDTLRVLGGAPLPRTAYDLDLASGRLLLGDSLGAGPWVIAYRYFVTGPRQTLFFRQLRLSVDSTAPEPQVDVFYDEAYEQTPDRFWEDSEGIRKSGSLSRGLTVGNNRGASVTSGLRLQLEGDLGDGLRIVGAITDENIPIQPDGTTQQISDFDRVFIRLMKDDYAVTIGDYEVSRKDSRFANFYRNVQGLQFERRTETSHLAVSGAVAKGKFHTNAFMGQDGISGPYRLTGQNGERFFIILAGSEKVYLNGALMTRGENADYVINYNTAELTFTARHVITNITRIVVDFEYNDRYYNRSLLVGQLTQKLAGDRVQVRFSYARDADNPNAPFEDPDAYLSVRDSLAELGDQPGLAVTSGIFDLGYSETETRYERLDTLVNGQAYVYYQRSVDPERARYGIDFSFVGVGEGFYEPAPGFNDNVFRWVGPRPDGRPGGSYAPVRTWVLPRQLQVADAAVEVELTQRLRLLTETAVSLEDRNRLSRVDDGDNASLAHRTALQWERVPLADSLHLTVEATQQFIAARYTNLDRLYQAEYERVWDLPNGDIRRDEHIGGTRLALDYRGELTLTAEGGVRYTGPGRTAYRQVYGVESRLPRMLRGQFTYTRIANTDDSLGRNARWNRYEGDIYAPLGPVRGGVVVWIEDKVEQRNGIAAPGSFAFVDLKPYLRTVRQGDFTADISFNYRKDREFLDGLMRDKSRAYTAYLQARYRPSGVLNLQSITSYRVLDVLDSAFAATGLDPARTLNTNLQATFAPKNRLVYTNFVYEVSAEQLARREIRFVEVPAGQGQYVWLDSLFNNDGVQDVEEFQIANNPLVANFIQVVVPTRELFPTTRLTLSGNVRWDLREVIAPSERFWPELLRQTRAVTNFRMSQNKTRDNGAGVFLINLLDPFGDSTLLDANYNLRQDLTFFQNSPRGDVKFFWQDTRSKLFLSTGEELRGFRFVGNALRYTLKAERSLQLETRLGRRFTEAAAFETRNFNIDYVETQPELVLQFNRRVRFSGAYAFAARRNTRPDSTVDAQVWLHKLIFDARWNLRERNNLFTKLELVHLRQRGEPGFSAEYELREGLRPGANAIWQVFLTLYPLQNVELSLTYDGRLSIDAPIVHTGRIQVRAFF